MSVLNSSIESRGVDSVLLSTGVGVLLGTSEVRLVGAVGSVPVWSEYDDLMSREEEGDHLVGTAPPGVGTGGKASSSVDTYFFS